MRGLHRIGQLSAVVGMTVLMLLAGVLAITAPAAPWVGLLLFVPFFLLAVYSAFAALGLLPNPDTARVVEALRDVQAGRSGPEALPALGGEYREMTQLVCSLVQHSRRDAEQAREQARAERERAAILAADAAALRDSLQQQGSRASDAVLLAREAAQSDAEVASRAAAVASAAQQGGEVARQGADVVQRAVDNMQRIAESVRGSATRIEELGRRSAEIGKVIGVITDVADQTNLLALNAAIEAARAGEHGRGFAVVADEVRKLAERTAQATGEIGQAIQAIQRETEQAVHAMRAGSEEVGAGVGLAGTAGRTLNDVVDSYRMMRALVEEIQQVTHRQRERTAALSQHLDAVQAQTADGRRSVLRLQAVLGGVAPEAAPASPAPPEVPVAA
ncbi:MAG: hypothetical protein IT463_13505 [Planctomycetes bacterium]|nr:hypothetical protein [Planctomycetota bacterium]